MSRRRRKSKVPTVTLDWTETVAKLFAPIPEAWTPPKRVRAWGDRSKSTWVARFVDESGQVNTARVRVERDQAAGVDWVVERSFTATFKWVKTA